MKKTRKGNVGLKTVNIPSYELQSNGIEDSNHIVMNWNSVIDNSNYYRYEMKKWRLKTIIMSWKGNEERKKEMKQHAGVM